MLHKKRSQSAQPEGRGSRRIKQTLAGGLVVALAVLAPVGLDSAAGSISPHTPDVTASSLAAALKLKAPKVTVTKVTATSTPVSTGTTVRSTLTVKNSASVRKPVLHFRLYLTNGTKKFTLGDAEVKSLAAGQSTTVRSTLKAPLGATAGKYSVVACGGAYAVQKCRTSAATVTIKPASLVSAPAALAIGDVAVGSTSTPRVVTVTNRGNATTGTLTTSIAAESAFSVASSTCGASLVPGASCKVSVVVSPAAPGNVLGSLAVSGTRAAPISIALTANGTGAALTISESTYDFDATVIGSASAPVEFVVTNTGNVATGALDASLSPAVGNDFEITASSCTQVLAPAASCTVGVAFAPATSGERTAALTVSGTPGGSVSTDLSGTGLTPATLSVAPETLAFGDELIGETTDTQTVTLTNDGDVASGDPVVTLDGDDADQFTVVDNDCTVALAADASCDVEVAFAPSASGVASARLVLTGAPGEVAYAALGGVGQNEANITIDESAYDFGYTDSPAEHVLTVTNTGDAASGVPTVDLDGSQSFELTTNTCTTALAGGASCTVGVTYTGSGSAEQSAELSVVTVPGGTVTAELTGSPLALTVTPTSHDYDGILVGNESGSKSYTLTNHRLASVQIDGENANGPFVVDTSCYLAVLPAGGTCTFSAHFAPTSEGPASGFIEYSAQAATARVELSGEGLSPAAFSVSPSTVDFGAYQPGDIGTQQVTITNTGTQPSTAISFSITGADAIEFYTDSTDCPTTLPGGASCTATVGFAPISLGDKTATFTVNGAPGGTASMIGLGAPAGVTLYPVTHDYGSVAVGGAQYFTFRVVNTTNNPEDMNSASSGPPFPLELNQDFSCVLIISTIQPHRWCTMTISFKPQSVGSFQTTLTAGGTNFNTQSQLLGTGVPSLARASGKSAASASRLPTSVTLRDGKPVVGYESR